MFSFPVRLWALCSRQNLPDVDRLLLAVTVLGGSESDRTHRMNLDGVRGLDAGLDDERAA